MESTKNRHRKANPSFFRFLQANNLLANSDEVFGFTGVPVQEVQSQQPSDSQNNGTATAENAQVQVLKEGWLRISSMNLFVSKVNSFRNFNDKLEHKEIPQHSPSKEQFRKSRSSAPQQRQSQPKQILRSWL